MGLRENKFKLYKQIVQTRFQCTVKCLAIGIAVASEVWGQAIWVHPHFTRDIGEPCTQHITALCFIFPTSKMATKRIPTSQVVKRVKFSYFLELGVPRSACHPPRKHSVFAVSIIIVFNISTKFLKQLPVLAAQKETCSLLSGLYFLLPLPLPLPLPYHRMVFMVSHLGVQLFIIHHLPAFDQLAISEL